jgi:hypothetical protein
MRRSAYAAGRRIAITKGTGLPQRKGGAQRIPMNSYLQLRMEFVLGFSLSSHRLSYTGHVFSSRFIDLIINNTLFWGCFWEWDQMTGSDVKKEYLWGKLHISWS